MTLDVVVPTYNRCGLLRYTLASLLRCPVPEGLEVSIFVVDNNSPDDTRTVVAEIQQGAPLPVHYVREGVQGSSQSRNAGIAAGQSELVGFVDDDEQVGEGWFQTIAREMQDTSIHYIGGPCLPTWEVPAPDWLPPGYHSVIGAIMPKPRGRYEEGHPGMLNGGNAVVRRSVFERIGRYSTRLGRGAKRLTSEEDAEFFHRLLRAQISGMYVPELIIHHYVPKERLTRSYHRRWAYWRAVSQGILDREQREPVTYFFGVPRHRIGRAVNALVALPGHRLAPNGKAQAFADELATWDLAGFIHGKFFIRLRVENPRVNQHHRPSSPLVDKDERQ